MTIAAARLLGALLAFALTALVAAQAPKVVAGAFFTAYAIAMLAAYLLRFGLDEIVLKFSASVKDGRSAAYARKILMQALVRLSSAGLLFILAIAVFRRYIGGLYGSEVAGALWILSAVPLLLAFIVLFAVFFQGQRRFYISMLGLTYIAPLVTAVPILTKDMLTAADLAAAYVAGYLVAAAIMIAYYMFAFARRSHLVSSDAAVSESPEERGFSGAIDLWLVGAANQFFLFGGQVLGGTFLDAERLAELAVATRFSQVGPLVLVIVNFLFAPRARELHLAGEHRQLRDTYLQSVRTCFLVTAGITLAMLLFMNDLLALLGEGYLGISPLFFTLWAGQAVNVILGPVGYLYVMSDRERPMAVTAVFSVTLMAIAIAVSAPLASPIAIAAISSVVLALYKSYLAGSYFHRIGPEVERSAEQGKASEQ